MATSPWTTDLDRLKRDLLQRIDRVAQDTRRGASNADSPTVTRLGDRVNGLDGLVAALRHDLTAVQQQLNRMRAADRADTTGDRLTAAEARIQRTVDEINRSLTRAAEEDRRLGGRIDAVERSVAALGRGR